MLSLFNADPTEIQLPQGHFTVYAKAAGQWLVGNKSINSF